MNEMSVGRIISALFVGLLATGFAAAAEEVRIVVMKKASSPERFAAEELVEALGGLYPETPFVIQNDADAIAGLSIRIGTPEAAPELIKAIGDAAIQGPKSYVVTTDGKNTGIIVSMRMRPMPLTEI